MKLKGYEFYDIETYEEVIFGILAQTKLMNYHIHELVGFNTYAIYLHKDKQGKESIHINFYKHKDTKEIKSVTLCRYEKGILSGHKETYDPNEFNDLLRSVVEWL